MTKWIDVVKKYVAEAKRNGKKANLKEILPKAKVEWASIKKKMGLPVTVVKKSKKVRKSKKVSKKSKKASKKSKKSKKASKKSKKSKKASKKMRKSKKGGSGSCGGESMDDNESVDNADESVDNADESGDEE